MENTERLSMIGSLVAEFFVELFQTQDTDDLPDRVKAIMWWHLLNRQPICLGDVASQLHRSVPTLRRHLNGHGTSFQTLMDQVRYDLANHLLREGLDFDKISECLGFSASSGFSRAYKEWAGYCPTEYLKNA